MRLKKMWCCIPLLCVISCASRTTKHQISTADLILEDSFKMATSSPRNVAATDDCDHFLTNVDLRFVRNQIRREGKLSRIIDGYQLSLQAILYTSLSQLPGCVLLERDGEVLFSGRLREPLAFPNYSYNFLKMSVSPAPTQPTPEVQNIFSEHRVDSALALNVDNPYPPAVEESWKKVLTGVALHEGFHFFYQQFLSPEPHINLWPVWNRVSEGFLNYRDKLSKICYLPNEAIQKMVVAELTTLKQALMPNTSDGEIRHILSDFVELRLRRYEALGDVKVGGRWSCRQLEDQFELREGMARFVEGSALIRLNLVKDDPALAIYFNPPEDYPAAFYPLGMFQMMVLEKLNSDRFRERVILPILTSETSQNSVFGQIQAAAAKVDRE